MVLQILADAAQRDPGRDAVRAQVVGIADAGQHQDLRRVDHAAGEDHLALARARSRLAHVKIFDADRAVVLDHDPSDQRIHLDVQVFPLHRRLEIGAGGAAAPAVADRHLPTTEAFLLRPL